MQTYDDDEPEQLLEHEATKLERKRFTPSSEDETHLTLLRQLAQSTLDTGKRFKPVLTVPTHVEDTKKSSSPDEINKEKRKAVMRALLDDDMEITCPAPPKESYSIKVKVKSDKKGITEFVEPEIMDLF